MLERSEPSWGLSITILFFDVSIVALNCDLVSIFFFCTNQRAVLLCIKHINVSMDRYDNVYWLVANRVLKTIRRFLPHSILISHKLNISLRFNLIPY